MRACCAVLILAPLALGANVQDSEFRIQNSEFRLTNRTSRSLPPPSTLHPPPPTASWIPQPFSHYEGILSRMPFGQAPAVSAAATAAAAAAAAQPPPAVPSKLTLCAINRTPNGALAVGFVDSGVNPPHDYYLDVGDSEDGFTVLNADIEQESAVIEKDGVSVTLKLPGSDRRVASAMDLAAQAAARFASLPQPPPDETIDAPPQKPNAFKSSTEQLLSMLVDGARSGQAPPPLPISEGDDMTTDVKAALTNMIVIYADDDNDTVKHKETVALIKEDMRQTLATNGGTSSSYIQRLYERQQEIEKTRREEAEKLRKLAENATREKIKAELDATNARLNTQEIPGLGQDEVIDPDEEDQ